MASSRAKPKGGSKKVVGTRTGSSRKTSRARSTSASKRSTAKNPRTGSSLESFLKEEGLYEDASAKAIKEVIAWQIAKTMTEQEISKSELARRMGTSASSINRLLDPQNESLTLSTLFRAATVLGAELRVELIPAS